MGTKLTASIILLVVVVTIIGANPIDDGDAPIEIGKEQVLASEMELRSNIGARCSNYLQCSCSGPYFSMCVKGYCSCARIK